MGRRGDPEDWRLFVILLRSFKHWQAKDLAKESGVPASMISLYERGLEVPSPETVRKLAAAVDFPEVWIEPLLAVLRTLRLAVADGTAAANLPETGLAGLDPAALEAELIGGIRLAVMPGVLELIAQVTEEQRRRRAGADDDRDPAAVE